MKKLKQGFTLIELMIVVAIIGIVASIAIPAFTNWKNGGSISSTVVVNEEVRPAPTTVPAKPQCAKDEKFDARGNPCAVPAVGAAK